MHLSHWTTETCSSTCTSLSFLKTEIKCAVKQTVNWTEIWAWTWPHLNHFCVAFPVCLGSLPCWKINLFLIIFLVHYPLYVYKPSKACSSDARPEDAATVMLYSRDGVFVVICGNCLIRPNNHLLVDLGVTHMALGEFQVRFHGSFFQQWLLRCYSPIQFSLMKEPRQQ